MSVSMESGSSSKGGSQDFDLNLAPIIDCLTVLIAFMLASASFLAIGILDAGVSAAGDTSTTATPPSISVEIQLAANHKYNVKVTGKSNATTPIDALKGTDWDFDGLNQNLAGLKAKYSDFNAVTLTAENAVEYKDVIKTMEALRKTMPAVLLGGF
jgi:biopolymer transport protein ExbD